MDSHLCWQPALIQVAFPLVFPAFLSWWLPQQMMIQACGP